MALKRKKAMLIKIKKDTRVWNALAAAYLGRPTSAT